MIRCNIELFNPHEIITITYSRLILSVEMTNSKMKKRYEAVIAIRKIVFIIYTKLKNLLIF